MKKLNLKSKLLFILIIPLLFVIILSTIVLFQFFVLSGDRYNYKIIVTLLFLSISAIFVTILMINSMKKILRSTDALEKENDNSLVLLQQYKQAIDRSFMVSKTDFDGIITYVNDEFCKTTGYSKYELLGKSHNIVRHHEMPQELFQELWHTIKELKDHGLERYKIVKRMKPLTG